MLQVDELFMLLERKNVCIQGIYERIINSVYLVDQYGYFPICETCYDTVLRIALARITLVPSD